MGQEEGFGGGGMTIDEIIGLVEDAMFWARECGVDGRDKEEVLEEIRKAIELYAARDSLNHVL